LGWLVVLSLPNQYSAKTVVYIDTSSALRPLLKGLAIQTDSRDELKIMTRVLLSRANLMSVIRDTDMDLEINSTAEKEALLERLTKSIKITGGGGRKWNIKSKVYQISYESGSANRSYQVVSNLLNTMIEDTLNTKRTDTVSAQKFLDSQIKIHEERLSLAERNLAQFRKENVGLMPGERGKYYVRLQRAKDAVKETASQLELANHRYSELSKQLKGESPILSSANYQSEKAKKIKAYQSELNILLYKYTENHPKVIGFQTIIKQLKEAPETPDTSDTPDTWSDSSDSDGIKEFNPVFQEIKVELNRTGIAIELLKVQLKKKENHVNKLNEGIDVIPEVEANLAKLNRGYNVTKKRYLNLVGRSESAKMAQSANQSSSDITFRVIEPPLVPFEPSGPDRVKFLSSVLLAALAAGLGWSFLLYLLQPTFINSTQLVSAINLPVLGSVSLYLTPEHRKKRHVQFLSFAFVLCLLVAAFGAVFLLRDSGVTLLASVLKEYKI